MYYLLEDNRIIYDEEILNEFKKRGNFNNLKTKINKNELQLIYINDKDISCIVHRVGNIKKQSENVFDLVEKGDLVNTIVDSIYQVVIIAKNVVIAPQWAFDLAEVTAIYKPDSKGNYIKVWEKKENE